MESFFNKFNNIFHGIIAGPLLIFVIMYLQLDTGRIIPPLDDNNFSTLSAASFGINLVYVLWVFRKFQKERKELIGKFSLKERLDSYLALSTKFYVLMSIPGVLAIVAVFLTGEMTFGFIYMLQLFLLSVYRPSVHNICKFLKLKGEEREFVLKKKEFEALDDENKKAATD